MTTYTKKTIPTAVAAIGVAACLATAAPATPLVTDDTDSVGLREGLLIDGIGTYGRSPVHRDTLEAQVISGAWTEPRAGDTIRSADGQDRVWRSVTADESGWFSDETRRGGYIHVRIDSDKERVMLLHMMGNSMAYVNGVPRVGSRYQYADEVNPWEPDFSFVRLPVQLKKGANEFLLQRAWRAGGRVKATLLKPEAEVLLNPDDVTAPDLLSGNAENMVGSVVVVNATPTRQSDLTLSVVWPDLHSSEIRIPVIQPMSVRKVPFPIEWTGVAPGDANHQELRLSILRAAEVLHQRDITLDVKNPAELHKRTYVSPVDGSVQYYAVNPAAPLPGDTTPPALVLSLHGARAKAINQAGSYAAKNWCTIVSPTNRRAYGFDWEDWGRLDALDVLALAQETLDHDPRRVFLTGHSMGGHGTWILGSMFPDRFAAIAPSAGWLSFWTYRGATKPQSPTPMDHMLMRADLAGDTLSVATNLKHRGVYILHGGGDKVVRPDQSYRMMDRLKAFHKNFVYHEEPGQGHWWDLSDEPGEDCVDWAPLFDFFTRYALPRDETLRQLEFTTVNPGYSDASHWVSIEDQLEHLTPSSVRIRVDPGRRRFVGTSENVARLRLSLDALPPGQPVRVELDGQEVNEIPYPAGKVHIWLENDQGRWRLGEPAAPAAKGPHRYGPFKAAFNHRMLFVYGTGGSAEENQLLRDKVRFDAEQWWFQGNGSVDIVADVEFNASDYPDRGVILYGNAASNRAWDQLLADSPVQIDAGGVTIGTRVIQGDDLACLFLRPRKDSDVACVAVVGGTGLQGMKLTQRLQYLFAGCNLPDCIVFGPGMLTEGVGGVRAAGVFGGDWGVDSGSFTWAEETPPAATDKPNELEAYIRSDPRPFVMPPGYVCYRTEGPIRVDGRLEETSWAKAPWTEDHVDIEGQMQEVSPRYRTRSKMLWDNDFFYVAAELKEPHVWGSITKRNEVIFHDNDFEVFVDPDGDSHNYFEFEVNALNTVWNLFLDKPYKHGGTAVIREMPGQTSGVHVQGTLNDPSDTDTCWTVEIAFPWRAMADHAGVACPPDDGDQWRVNLSRVEWGHRIVDGAYVRVPGKEEKADDLHEDNWVWAPQGRINIHRPETWGYVQFSTQPAGSGVPFQPDPTAYMRYLLHKVLYAQEAYVLKNDRYADTLTELGLEAHADIPIALHTIPTGWEATGVVEVDAGASRTMRIREDGKVEFR